MICFSNTSDKKGLDSEATAYRSFWLYGLFFTQEQSVHFSDDFSRQAPRLEKP